MSVTAEKIMAAPVITVSPEATLEEAIKILAKNDISGLPVVDAQNKLVGIISEKDIIEYTNTLHVVSLLGTSGWISPHTDVSDIAAFKKGAELLSTTSVEKVMSKKVVTATRQTTSAELAKLMRKRNVNRLPVVDDDGTVEGIVSRADLLKSLADQ